MRKKLEQDAKEVAEEVMAEAKSRAASGIIEILFGKKDDPEDKGIVGENKKKVAGAVMAAAIAGSVAVSNTDNSVNHVGGDQVKTTMMSTSQVNKVDKSVRNITDNSKHIKTGDINNAKNVSF